MKKLFLLVILGLMILNLSCLLSAEKSQPERDFFVGFLVLPLKNQSFEEAYQQACRYIDFVPVWGRPSLFYELPEDLEGEWGRVFLKEYIYTNNMFPIIHFSFFSRGITLVSPPDISQPALDDPQWRKRYKEAVLEVVRRFKPPYISLGNEVNRWYEKYGFSADKPYGFKHYVSLYEELYDRIKEISPSTKVFCVFSREIVSEHREADLSVLKLFNPDKLDILVFTTYPYTVKGVRRPEDLPDDYYKKAFNYIKDKPMGFSEVAWPSLSFFGGEESQAEFVKELTGRLTQVQGIKLEFIGWSWWHDLNSQDATGLLYEDGREKKAWKVWKTLFGK